MSDPRIPKDLLSDEVTDQSMSEDADEAYADAMSSMVEGGYVEETEDGEFVTVSDSVQSDAVREAVENNPGLVEAYQNGDEDAEVALLERVIESIPRREDFQASELLDQLEQEVEG